MESEENSRSETGVPKAGSLADKAEMVGSPDKGGIQAAIVDHLDRVVIADLADGAVDLV